jgi:hypothetical protein
MEREREVVERRGKKRRRRDRKNWGEHNLDVKGYKDMKECEWGGNERVERKDERDIGDKVTQ